MLSSPSVINNFTTTTALLCQYFHPTSLFFFFPLPSPCFESRELGNAQRAPLFARAHLHPPRNYLAYLPTEAVLRGIHSRRFKLQNCIPKKEGKLHREDSKRNAKEVGGERRRSNKRMQFTKGKGGVLALSIISYTAARPASRVLIALQASHYPEFRRLISKSAFYRSKFASSRCLWTKIQAKEVDNKRCTHVLIWIKKQRF